jgi:hypothetical protein
MLDCFVATLLAMATFTTRARAKASAANQGTPTLQTTRQIRGAMALSCALLALLSGSAPASAVEQCRFIQAKPEREACYQRQEAELAAKRKPEPRRDTAMDALEQMKQEDEALNRQIHGICRGC